MIKFLTVVAENIITDIKQTEEKARQIINEAKKNALAKEKEAFLKSEDLIRQRTEEAKQKAAKNIENKEAEAKKEAETIKQSRQEETATLILKVTPKLKSTAALIKDRIKNQICQ